MNLRPFLAAILASTTLMATVPRSARAQETPTASTAPWVAPVYRPEILSPRIAPDASGMLSRTEARWAVPGSATTELAVSRGAKIAIIVCAIVVGVILLVGIFTIGPGHHGP